MNIVNSCLTFGKRVSKQNDLDGQKDQDDRANCPAYFYLWLLSWHKYKDHYDQSKPRRQLIKDGRDGKQNQGNQDHDNKEDQDSLIEKSLLNSGTPASEQDHTDKHTLQQQISVMDFD